jgi:hypothetical protein
MNTKQTFVLLFVIIIGATVANLIALKIAGDQVSEKLKDNKTAGSLLGLLGGG